MKSSQDFLSPLKISLNNKHFTGMNLKINSLLICLKKRIMNFASGSSKPIEIEVATFKYPTKI